MKQQISPVVAVVVIVVVLGIAAFGWVRSAGVRKESKPPPTMPASVAKDWAKYTNGAAAGRGTSGSIPSSQSGPTSSPPTSSPMGGMMGSPPGMSGSAPGMSGPPPGMSGAAPGMSGPPPGMP